MIVVTLGRCGVAMGEQITGYSNLGHAGFPAKENPETLAGS
jgi:hypothetical protein